MPSPAASPDENLSILRQRLEAINRERFVILNKIRVLESKTKSRVPYGRLKQLIFKTLEETPGGLYLSDITNRVKVEFEGAKEHSISSRLNTFKGAGMVEKRGGRWCLTSGRNGR